MRNCNLRTASSVVLFLTTFTFESVFMAHAWSASSPSFTVNLPIMHECCCFLPHRNCPRGIMRIIDEKKKAAEQVSLNIYVSALQKTKKINVTQLQIVLNILISNYWSLLGLVLVDLSVGLLAFSSSLCFLLWHSVPSPSRCTCRSPCLSCSSTNLCQKLNCHYYFCVVDKWITYNTGRSANAVICLVVCVSKGFPKLNSWEPMFWIQTCISNS